MLTKLTFLIASIILLSCTQKKSFSPLEPKVQTIATYLDSLKGFSGAVLIAENDRILFKEAYGYAHLGHKIKNRVDTKFSYASIGKSFTAVAIFQLIQAGKLSLDDTIGEVLPDYPNEFARNNITIRMLLTHRSGLPNYFHSPTFLNTSKEQFRTLENLAYLYENEPLESNPNEQFAYRNTNYIVLGRIIEVVSKIPYNDYIKKYIFTAAQMQHSGNFDIDHVIENSAENYTLSDVYPGQLQKTTFMSSVKGSSAGGGYTTIDDLYQFASTFKKGDFLNANYVNLMKTRPKDDWYGYGVQFSGAKGSGIFGHSGGHFGVGAEWRIFEKQNYTVILLTNKDLDQGFLDARFFIEKTIAGSTPKLENYFFTKRTVSTCLEKGIEEAKKTIKASTFELSEMDLNGKGYEMIKRGFNRKAIDLFTLETLAFPTSYDAYDSLGEAFMADGQIENAIDNYHKSLALNPENDNAKEKLTELQEQKRSQDLVLDFYDNYRLHFQSDHLP